MGRYTPKIVVTEEMPRRVLIAETDQGAELRQSITDLEDLMGAYKKGTTKESR